MRAQKIFSCMFSPRRHIGLFVFIIGFCSQSALSQQTGRLDGDNMSAVECLPDSRRRVSALLDLGRSGCPREEVVHISQDATLDPETVSIQSIFEGASLLLHAFKQPPEEWWQRPLAERLNASINSIQAKIASLTMKDVAGVARLVGMEGPVFAPSPVLSAPLAQLNPQAPLTLIDVWRAATSNNRAIRAARAGVQAAVERSAQVRAQALPQVQFSASRFANSVYRSGLNTVGQPLEIIDRYESGNQVFSARQQLFRPALSHQATQARLIGEEAQALLHRETQNLAARVVGAYLEALLAQDQLELIRSQQRFLQIVLAAESRALSAGSGTRTAVDEASARLELNRAREVQARQMVNLTRHQVEELVNQPIGALARLDPNAIDVRGLIQGNLEDWIGKAHGTSPELHALQAQFGQQLAEIGKVRAGHLPTIDLVAQTQRSRSENVISPQTSVFNQQLGIQLTVPLYNGGLVNSQIRQLSAESERTREQLEGLRLDLGVRVHREFHSVVEGAPMIRSLEAAARSADVALDSATKSMAAGVRSMVDVLNAEQQRAQVTRDLAQARYQWVGSIVRLHAVSGVINEDTISRISAMFKP